MCSEAATNPSTRHPALSRLNVLIGDWDIVATVDGQTLGLGRTSFSWLGDEPFVIQRVEAGPAPEGAPSDWQDNAPEPVTQIFGLDDTRGQFTVLYADSRNVFRAYQMSLTGNVWQVWRDAPGFHQRFTGSVSDDGNTIAGAWEYSPDGTAWTHDFNLSYHRASSGE